MASLQTESRDKPINHSCQLMHSLHVFLLIIYVIDPYFLFKFFVFQYVYLIAI